MAGGCSVTIQWRATRRNVRELTLSHRPSPTLVEIIKRAVTRGNQPPKPTVVENFVTQNGATVQALKELGIETVLCIEKGVGEDGPALGRPIFGTVEQLLACRLVVERMRELIGPDVTEARALELASVLIMNGELGWPGTPVSLELVEALELDLPCADIENGIKTAQARSCVEQEGV